MVLADLDAAIESFAQTTPVPLPSEPNTKAAFGRWFAAPPTRASAESDAGEALWTISSETRTCGDEPSRELDKLRAHGLVQWSMLGLGMADLPGQRYGQQSDINQ